MGVKDKVEACGRCAMTSVVGVTDEGEGGKNPFDGPRIELAESEMRAVSKHVVYLGRLKDRLNEWMANQTYGIER